MAVLMADQINVTFLAAMLRSRIAQHGGHMMFPDDDADIHAGQFGNLIPCQLAGLFITVDNMALEVQ
ncbi:hypothetical protein D3C81_2214070 [compost metagenome]